MSVYTRRKKCGGSNIGAFGFRQVIGTLNSSIIKPKTKKGRIVSLRSKCRGKGWMTSIRSKR